MDSIIKAEPFSLNDVRLLDGVFRTTEDIDGKYILSLDPERLLHNFRVNAHLPSTAAPLGGWEAPNYGLRGHFVGHYLSACAEMFAATGDTRFLDRSNYMVSELAKCQEALGAGYLSAFPSQIFDKLEAANGRAPAPYYTIHKIMAGLLDQYYYCRNKEALQMAEKMADYFQARMAKLDPGQIEKILNTIPPAQRYEYGGMSEVLHNLYAITRSQKYLDFAGLFDRPSVLAPLAHEQDILPGLHANTHIPQVVGFARHHELTGDGETARAARYFWSDVVLHHSYATGSDSRGEVFLGPDVEASALRDDTGETCNVYNMLKLTEHLFSWGADPMYADYYELALFNHILPSIDPDSGMTTYYISLTPGHFKIYGTPDQSFWCCNGTGIENHAKYGGAIYFHHQDSLWVNLFIPSRLEWREKGVEITQNTNFPDGGQVSLSVQCHEPTHLRLMLRVPYWAGPGATVSVNGDPHLIPAAPGSYAVLDRTWRAGETVTANFPLQLRLRKAIDNPKMVSVMYGPLVLAGDLGRENMPPIDQTSDHRGFFKIPDPPVPGFTGDSSELSTWIKPIGGKPANFTVALGGGSSQMVLKPFYQIHHERYSVYWKFVDASQASQAPVTNPANHPFPD